MSSRRDFLRKLAITGGAAGLGGNLLAGCVHWIDPAPVVSLPAPTNGLISIDPLRFPDLSPVGGAIALRAQGAPEILLVHVGTDSYAAVSAICTHAACPLGVDNGIIECPCHLSQFGADGVVIRPPAKQALRTYPAQVDGTSGDVIISLLAGTPGWPSVQNGMVTFGFTDFPDLQKPNNAVVGTPVGMSNPIIVVAKADGTYAALDAVCTHLGCTVGYAASAGNLLCPCHGSIFGLDGSVLAPPATTPLATYAVSWNSAGVTVTVA